MDDQASKLRQLVRRVRHATTVCTGPPLLLVYSANDDALSERLLAAVRERLAAAGVACMPASDTHETTSGNACRLAHRTGAFESSDLPVWQQASVLIAVLFSDDETVIDCYTQLKRAYDHTPLPPVELAMVGDEPEILSSAAQRLAQTCERFLHCRVAGVTSLREQDTMAVDGLVGRLLAMVPVTPAAHNPLALTSDLPL